MMSVQSITVVDALASLGSGKGEIERQLAEFGLGIVYSLEQGETSIEQAERDLFNLETYNAAKRNRLTRQLIEFLQWGMELDDVRELAPEGLPESYGKMKRLARRVIAQSLAKSLSVRAKRKAIASNPVRTSRGR